MGDAVLTMEQVKALLQEQGSQIVRVTQELINHSYRQQEGLQKLYHFLRPVHPLPDMRHWAISPDFAALLMTEIMNNAPKMMMELGSGVSTLVSAYALKQYGEGKGKLVSLEHEAEYLEKTKAEVKRHGLEDWVELHHAPLMAMEIGGRTWQWYDISQINLPDSIDMLMVDGPPGITQVQARYPAFPALKDRFSDHMVILLDDAARKDEQACVKEWLEQDDGFVVESRNYEKGAAILRRR